MILQMYKTAAFVFLELASTVLFKTSAHGQNTI